jgi:hypothetical protein
VTGSSTEFNTTEKAVLSLSVFLTFLTEDAKYIKSRTVQTVGVSLLIFQNLPRYSKDNRY